MPPIPAQTEGTRWSSATWGVCIVLLLASTLNYMDRQTLGNVQTRVEKEFSLTNEHYGNLELGFGLAFAAGAIVFGVLADHVNVRWLYPLMIMLWSTAGAVTAYSRTYEQLLLCRIFLGFFEAAHWPCALRTTQRLLAPSERTAGNSILQSGTSIGAIITPLIILAMLRNPETSWRSPFLLIGGLGFVWLFAWFAVSHQVNLAPGVHGISKELVNDQGKDDAFVSKFLFRIGATLAIMMIWYFARTWLGTYFSQNEMLTKMQKLSLFAASRVTVNLVSILTCVSMVWLQGRSEAIHRVKWVIFAGSIVCVATTLFTPWFHEGLLLLGILLVIVFGRSSKDRKQDSTFIVRFLLMVVVIVTINAAWQIFRAWLPKFLEQGRGYTENERLLFTAAFNVSTDVGCLVAGLMTVWLTRLGESVGRTRRIVFTGCALCCATSVFLPWLPQGPPLLGVLLVIAAGLLGLFPCYYTWSQDLSGTHQGKVTGLLSTIAWLVSSPIQKYYGRLIDFTKDYNLKLEAAGQVPWIGPFDAGLAVIGCTPLIGALVIWLWWEEPSSTVTAREPGE